MDQPLNYGNWIRKKNLVILGLSAAGLGVLSRLPLGPLYQLGLIGLFAVAAISFLFPLYAYVMFSQRGGRLQDRVYDLIIRQVGRPLTGRLLDIGSGNGVLAVKLAQQAADAEVVGLDDWGKDWEYSQAVCNQNARRGGVAARVHFQKGDAAALTFASDTFDGAVSNLTFHEVRSVANKRAVVREALRVVKPGGRFAFVDYFYAAQHYGPAAEFERYLKSLKLAHCELRPLSAVLALPLLLRHPKILGRVGIISGTK